MPEKELNTCGEYELNFNKFVDFEIQKNINIFFLLSIFIYFFILQKYFTFQCRISRIRQTKKHLKFDFLINM